MQNQASNQSAESFTIELTNAPWPLDDTQGKPAAIKVNAVVRVEWDTDDTTWQIVSVEEVEILTGREYDYTYGLELSTHQQAELAERCGDLWAETHEEQIKAQLADEIFDWQEGQQDEADSLDERAERQAEYRANSGV